MSRRVSLRVKEQVAEALRNGVIEPALIASRIQVPLTAVKWWIWRLPDHLRNVARARALAQDARPVPRNEYYFRSEQAAEDSLDMLFWSIVLLGAALGALASMWI